MKYSFLHQNIQSLSFEAKTILAVHAISLVLCFCPWFSAAPLYGEAFYYNAFGGELFLTGWVIFLLSFVIVVLFVDRLLEKYKIKLPFNENWFYAGVGMQQILLLILAASALSVVSREFGSAELRFGLFLLLVVQVVGLVAVFLKFQVDAKLKATKFFQHNNSAKNNPNPSQ